MRKARGGRIPQGVQLQAREKESPVVSELLLAARKGRSEQVAELLRQDPSQASVVDKVCHFCMHSAPSVCKIQVSTGANNMPPVVPSMAARACTWRVSVATSPLLWPSSSLEHCQSTL